MIFHKWEDVHNWKQQLYVVVDEKFNGDPRVLNFSNFNIDMTKAEHPRDFFDSSSPSTFIYFAFSEPKSIPLIPNRVYIFKKNKLYKFGRTWYDELENSITDYRDIWYEPFLFVAEEDYEQAVRYLKLKTLENEKI